MPIFKRVVRAFKVLMGEDEKPKRRKKKKVVKKRTVKKKRPVKKKVSKKKVTKKKVKKKVVKKKAKKKKVVKKKAVKKKKAKKKVAKKKVKKVLKKKPLKKKIKKKAVKKKKMKKPVKKALRRVKGKASSGLGEQVGVITHYFSGVKAGIIKIEKGTLRIGDQIHIKGVTSDFKQKIKSMQINRKDVEQASKGEEIGIITKSKVRERDVVYKVVNKNVYGTNLLMNNAKQFLK